MLVYIVDDASAGVYSGMLLGLVYIVDAASAGVYSG